MLKINGYNDIVQTPKHLSCSGLHVAHLVLCEVLTTHTARLHRTNCNVRFCYITDFVFCDYLTTHIARLHRNIGHVLLFMSQIIILSRA